MSYLHVLKLDIWFRWLLLPFFIFIFPVSIFEFASTWICKVVMYLCYSYIPEHKFHAKKVDHEEKDQLGLGMLLLLSRARAHYRVCVCFFGYYLTSTDILQILGLLSKCILWFCSREVCWACLGNLHLLESRLVPPIHMEIYLLLLIFEEVYLLLFQILDRICKEPSVWAWTHALNMLSVSVHHWATSPVAYCCVLSWFNIRIIIIWRPWWYTIWFIGLRSLCF